MVPFDTKSPFVTSGIRIGTPALTTRGMKEDEMIRIGEFIHRVLSDPEDQKHLSKVREEIREFSKSYLIYQDLK